MGFLLPLHLPSNIFGVVVVTPAALFIVYKIIHGLLSRSKLPPGPRGWPWIGYTPCLGSRAFNELQRLESIYGKIVSFQLLGKTVVVINDYQMIQQMDGPNRTKVGRYALTVNDLLARRLGMSNYDTPRALALRQAWLRHLYGYSEMINYLNNDPNKSDLAKAFETEVHTLIDTLHRLAGEPIRVDQLMRRTVWRMMWNLAFGSPCELSTGQIDRVIYDLSTNNMENSMLQISQMFPKFFIPILRYIPFTRSLLGIHKINARYDDIGQILNTEVARVLDKDRPRSAFLRRLKEDEKLAVQGKYDEI
ncbi:unnamed protein product [Calicophoron daubneyi]|uniref:Cytochrome P450 n=1 Tax=Calicophoron daubneyi TaxID=300641 RepID=A0AAV2TGZ1_CALDB